MPRLRLRLRFESLPSVSDCQTAVDWQSFIKDTKGSRNDQPNSIFQESFNRLCEPGGTSLFDLSEIIKQTPTTSLRSLADRKIVQAFCNFVGGPDLWDGLMVPSIETHVDSVDSDSAAFYSGTRSAELVSKIKREASWYFDPENLKPGAPGWKLEREIQLVFEASESQLPQAKRLRLLGDSELQPPIWGSELLRKHCQENQSELACAETLSFRASALGAMVDPQPILDSDGEEINEPFALDPEAYEEASPETKARLLCDVQRRFMIWHATTTLSPGFQWQFFSRMTIDWLHMVAVNGKIPEVMCGVNLPEWYAEHLVIQEDETHDMIEYYQWQSKRADIVLGKDTEEGGPRQEGGNQT